MMESMGNAVIIRTISDAGSDIRIRRPGAGAFLAVALLGIGAMPASAETDGAIDTVTAAAHRPSHRQGPRGLDGRVALLARELDLDPGQQVALRKMLEEQGVQVAQAWNDTSVPGATRVGRTQAISDRTAERIRAMLNDEQRRKYIQPRQRETSVGAPGGRVETWMKPGKTD
jgi:hypothetical protein